jgi:hypothetical protein
MSNDNVRSARESAEYTEPRAAVPAMYCAECRTIMRLAYFSQNGRPLCMKCSSVYRERIDRGTGAGAMSRAVLYGGGAAIAGMIGVAILLSVFNAFRIISAIGVAYLIAKAIGKATGNYGGRRYQVLAVSLTYVALGLAMLMPVIRATRQLERVKAPPKVEARTGPAGETAEINDEIRNLNAAPREGEDPAVTAARADSLAAADSVARLEKTRANIKANDGNAAFSDRLVGGAGKVFFGALTLLVILPLLSSFSYGIYAGVISIFALGFALKKAWDLTDLVTDLELTGPHKVGTGPIAPAFGG